MQIIINWHPLRATSHHTMDILTDYNPSSYQKLLRNTNYSFKNGLVSVPLPTLNCVMVRELLLLANTNNHNVRFKVTTTVESFYADAVVDALKLCGPHLQGGKKIYKLSHNANALTLDAYKHNHKLHAVITELGLPKLPYSGTVQLAVLDDCTLMQVALMIDCGLVEVDTSSLVFPHNFPLTRELEFLRESIILV